MTAGVTETSRFMRRMELEAVMKSPEHTYQHVDFLVDLALRHRWRVMRANNGRFTACTETRTAYIPCYVDDDESFAMFLHETAGHLEDPNDATRPFLREQHANGVTYAISFEAELDSWRAAMACAGRRWSARANKAMESALWTYRQSLVMYPQWRKAMDDLVAAGAEQARHVVRMLPHTEAVRCR